jgi:hypothetical protein
MGLALQILWVDERIVLGMVKHGLQPLIHRRRALQLGAQTLDHVAALLFPSKYALPSTERPVALSNGTMSDRDQRIFPASL